MQPISSRHGVVRAMTVCRLGVRGGQFSRAQGVSRRYASKKASPKRNKIPEPLPFRPSKSTTESKPPKDSPQKEPPQQDGEKQSARKKDLIQMHRGIGLFGMGAGALAMGAFTSMFLYHWFKEPVECHPLGNEPDPPTGRPSVQSPVEFDMHLDKSEWRLGITKLRREVARRARGHVLEVAVGTGRNFEFYDWGTVPLDLLPEPARGEALRERAEQKGATATGWFGLKRRGDDEPNKAEVLSFTGIDISPSMLDVTLKRLRQTVPHMAEHLPKKPSFAMLAAPVSDAGTGTTATTATHGLRLARDRIRILHYDVEAPLLPPPPPAAGTQHYDTIIQTFGLCSVRDPVALLALMAARVRPGTGRILLIEHGRSSWAAVVNGLLDRSARGHFQKFGCWWNRDVDAIVAAAQERVPALEVVELARPGWSTFGTHLLVELRVRDGAQVPVPAPAVAAGGNATSGGGSGKSWWGSLFPASKTDGPEKKA
ncbi:hypothetical protein F4780DRAFT_764430 [Xylariomycetidae sp. FL0641]|nr:hypothetical protein F4780DRAFT_764430 [Xylariomycetidae sp. FL0641]